MNVSDSSDRHAIEEQNAVEVIGLVLDHARRQARARRASPCGPSDRRRATWTSCGARHAAADVGDAQAAFPALVRRRAGQRELRIDQRHERHLVVVVERPSGMSASRTPATKMRTLSCTCGAARPMPAYSRIVSNMSSMSCWTRGDVISAGGTALALGAQHGVPHARDFQNRHRQIIRRNADGAAVSGR